MCLEFDESIANSAKEKTPGVHKPITPDYMQNEATTTKLISLNKWLKQIGITSTTAWRWRKKGILRTINIYGRLYISEDAIADFLRRANGGEFAIVSRPGKKGAIK